MSPGEWASNQEKRIQAGATALRHRLWLRRSSDATGESWLPSKKHRTSSARWTVKLDNQLYHGTVCGGLLRHLVCVLSLALFCNGSLVLSFVGIDALLKKKT